MPLTKLQVEQQNKIFMQVNANREVVRNFFLYNYKNTDNDISIALGVSKHIVAKITNELVGEMITKMKSRKNVDWGKL